MALSDWVLKKRLKEFPKYGFSRCATCAAGARLDKGDENIPPTIVCGDAKAPGALPEAFIIRANEVKDKCPRILKAIAADRKGIARELQRIQDSHGSCGNSITAA